MAERIKKYNIHIYIGQLALLAVLSAGWWGILYPDLSMTEDTFEAVAEEADEGKGRSGTNAKGDTETSCVLPGAEAFFSMLEAEPGKVEIKSRFAEIILGIRGRENE